ncbi:FAD:protein FMN transferase [Rhodococcoides fascians]|uniref:FAD:protein FMN transferase n=1 Tax=Rhodococcoides fascians TaxID=1828 RepID=UPI0037ACCEB7
MKGSSFSLNAIGTRWSIATPTPLTASDEGEILALSERFERVWSRFRADSVVTEVASAASGGHFEFPVDDLALFELYDRLVAATDGGIDPLVGRDLELLGYDAEYSLIPDEHAMARRRGRATWFDDVHRDSTTIATTGPVVIDVGAAGKGYLVDLMSHWLIDAGVDSFVVDGSGDIRHRGSDPVVIGLEHPTLPSRVIGKVALRDGALCASATSRRAWGPGLHHIVDGRTGIPVSEVTAVWTMADDAATADGLATALFMVDPSRLNAFDFRWVRMMADGRIQWSNDFEGELFI